jgi:thiol:disulfide interchange protein
MNLYYYIIAVIVILLILPSIDLSFLNPYIPSFFRMEKFKSNSSSSNKKIIFTSYTADWCPHCVDFKEKTYGKLVAYFANSPNIKITNVDCTNDNSGKTRTLAGNQIDGFPTLVINTYENGKMSETMYDGSRDADSIIQYLKGL